MAPASPRPRTRPCEDQATATERLLDQRPGGRRRARWRPLRARPERQGRRPRRSSAATPRPSTDRPEDQDRPVPQVQRVRDPTKPSQRCPREDDPSGRPEDPTGGDQGDRADASAAAGQGPDRPWSARSPRDSPPAAPHRASRPQTATARGTRPSSGAPRREHATRRELPGAGRQREVRPGACVVGQHAGQEERAGEDRGREGGHR